MTDHIDRVRALIAKAESSAFPAEADLFMAKAQQIIDEQFIDEAAIRRQPPGSVGHEEIPMSGSYSRERAQIWHAVTQANRCQLLTLSGYRSNKVQAMTLVGRTNDRHVVRLLAGSLELQGMRRLSELDTSRSHESAVVQRRSFLRGFANEVAQRLEASRRQTVQSAVNIGRSRESVEQALVLATDAVERYVDDTFELGQQRRSQNRIDGAAYSRGRRAGASADVGATGLSGARASLPPAR